jgi:hypothetical protein
MAEAKMIPRNLTHCCVRSPIPRMGAQALEVRSIEAEACVDIKDASCIFRCNDSTKTESISVQ